jgi:hypothetical protein
MRSLLFGFAILLGPVPALAAEMPSAFDDAAASIEVGRYGVMLDQVTAARKLLAPSGAPIPAKEAPTGSLYEILVATVVRFNALSDQVCRDVELPAADCAGPFRPAWLSAPPADQPQLRAMIDEAGSRITTYWSDVCTRAKAARGDEHLCDIE